MKDPRMAEEQTDWFNVGSISHPETVPNEGLQYIHQMFEWDRIPTDPVQSVAIELLDTQVEGSVQERSCWRFLGLIFFRSFIGGPELHL